MEMLELGEGSHYIGTVIYNDGSFWIKSENTNCQINKDLIEEYELEVVGNIFENPKLS